MNNYYFRDVEPNTFVEMSDKQINEAFAFFKQALKEHPEDFLITGNPVTENAYTSSSYIPGIYFPNTNIRMACSTYYEVCCLALSKDGKYCIAMSVIEDRPENLTESAWKRFKEVCKQFTYVPIEEIVYSRAEIKARSDLISYIKGSTFEAKALAAIKRAYKKDGNPFARLEANFPGVSITLDRSFVDGKITRITISGSWFQKKYIKTDIYMPEEKLELNADDVEQAIKKHCEHLLENVASYKKQLAVCHSAFIKCQAAVKKARSVLAEIKETEFGGGHSHLYYVLGDYMSNEVRY